MLRKHCNRWLLIVVLALMLGACIPYSFSPPKEVHIDPGDSVRWPQIAVDAEGVSHLVGVVDDRIVYYRTHFGEPVITHNFTMSAPGAQHNPDIAVTDNGDVYIVWVEYRSDLGQFACWQKLPFFMPPGEEWPNDCEPLDEVDIQTTGNVRVVARGNKAYAVYDSMYTGDYIDALMYKELTHPSTTGHVFSYIDYSLTGFIYSLDLGIDSLGYLHVGFHDKYNPAGGTTYNERLSLHSNVSVYDDGDMAQHWLITTTNSTNESVPVSLSFGKISGIEYVALASVDYPSENVDSIWIHSCTSNGCSSNNSFEVVLPSSWDTYSKIFDVEIQGGDDYLDLAFLGRDNPMTYEQVYYKKAYSPDDPRLLSDTIHSMKTNLNMVSIVSRDPSYTARPALTSIAWVETIINTDDSTRQNRFFTYDVPEFNKKVKVYEETCSSLVLGDIHSNGSYFSGVWYVCGDTWFSTQAWTNQLPLIMK